MVIVSLLLFAGTIVSWCMLPGGQTSTARHEEIEAVPHAAVKLAQ